MPVYNPLAKFSRAGQIATRRCKLRLALPLEKAIVEPMPC
jgi:hypothetical protein